jgi:hypothetical protein
LSVLAHQQTTILRNDFARRAGRRSGVPYFPIARQAFEANCRRQVTITTKAVDRKRVGPPTRGQGGRSLDDRD